MSTLKPQYLLIFLVLLILWSCEKKEKDLTSLEGSWNLVEYIPGTNTETEWTQYGDSILYQKHLSPDHFVWFKYDQNNSQLMGMGGGTYVIKDGKYVENIQFFFPPGSSELGQSIPFDFELKGKTWYHKGYAKAMEVNMESGKLEVIDSNKIEERWVKTSAKPNENEALVGTWDLISYRDSLDTKYTEYPDFVGYMKLLTPTHFTWIYYDIDGDEIFAAGSGAYTYNESTYKETISMIYPDNTGQLGETIRFSAKIDHNNWKHLGYLPIVSIDSNSGDIVRDSSLIDERWELHQDNTISEIIF